MGIIPELGSSVEVRLIGQVVGIARFPDGDRITVRVDIGGGSFVDVTDVPSVCSMEFDPVRESVWNDEVMSYGRHG